ncbi:hypothetical protein ACSU1N_07290 [Thermogladius sp. 4427co]|uniref:hypothetical protein n=1 Tax=Thermogladius sp. 4427co TaxID=3450718 RepID=UPI003F78F037
MNPLNVYSATRAFLEKYGDKGFMVLKAALDVAGDPNIDHRYGDFSFKSLVLRLARLGFNYNPVNLLRALEKEYGVIEKSYTSSSQTWWRFRDPEAVRKAVLGDTIEIEDPRISLLKIKYEALEPGIIKNHLVKLASKTVLTKVDREGFRRIVFEDLPKLVELYYEMLGYEDYFKNEISTIREIIRLAELVSARLSRSIQAPGLEAVEESERAIRLYDNL